LYLVKYKYLIRRNISKRILTDKQVHKLSKNPNVTSCSGKSITFSKTFKTNAVRLHKDEYLTYSQIFRQAGFDINVITKERAKGCLGRWGRIYRKGGSRGLSETRGSNTPKRRPKILDATDTDKIKRLEAEVAYLKAENDFLAKLRAKKAE